MAATSADGGPLHAGLVGGASVWYRWTPDDVDGGHPRHRRGSDFDTMLAVYTGSSLRRPGGRAEQRRPLRAPERGHLPGDRRHDLQDRRRRLGRRPRLVPPVARRIEPARQRRLRQCRGPDGRAPDRGRDRHERRGDRRARRAARQHASSPRCGTASRPRPAACTCSPAAPAPCRSTSTSTSATGSTHSRSCRARPPSSTAAPTRSSPTLTAGTTYSIVVDGRYGGADAFQFGVFLSDRPANDDFADAQVLDGSLPITVNGNTGDATTEPGEPDHSGNPADGASVWYRWTPAETMWVAVDGGAFCWPAGTAAVRRVHRQLGRHAHPDPRARL